MTTRNADKYNVVEALENCREDIERGRLVVWDTDAVMKGMSDEEMKQRNLNRDVDNIICYIRWEGSSSSVLKFTFHENSVENEFCLTPEGKGLLHPRQATHPGDLGASLKFVTQQLDYAYDTIWDFAKVDGASYAHGGYITDYEFEYEVLI